MLWGRGDAQRTLKKKIYKAHIKQKKGKGKRERTNRMIPNVAVAKKKIVRNNNLRERF